MTWPEPGADFTLLTETLPAGTLLFRVHNAYFPDGALNDGTVFNPGYGGSARFSFFGEPTVPVLYAAMSPEAAVHETILRNAEPGSALVPVTWRNLMLSVIEVREDVQLAAFHGAGLRRLGLFPRELTDTPKMSYPSTVKWAEAAWQKGLSGVAYMPRHFNSATAYCLFGDRVSDEALSVKKRHPASRLFDTSDDVVWLAEVARAVNVRLRSFDW